MKNVLRWIICIPAGILAGWVVVLLYMMIGGRFEPEPGSLGFFIKCIAGGTLSGIASAYSAAYVAPNRRDILAWIMIVLTIVSMAFVLPMVEDKQWADLTLSLAQDIAIVVVSVNIIAGKITFD